MFLHIGFHIYIQVYILASFYDQKTMTGLIALKLLIFTYVKIAIIIHLAT